MKLAARGRRNKEIVGPLSIAEDTVKIHLKNIFSKREVLDRTQAEVAAAQCGFFELGILTNRVGG